MDYEPIDIEQRYYAVPMYQCTVSWLIKVLHKNAFYHFVAMVMRSY